MISDSPYTKAISAGILKLQEDGILQQLKTKWWKEMHGGGMCVVSRVLGSSSIHKWHISPILVEVVA